MIIEYVVYIVSGALVSMIGSMSGIGGGVFMVPLFYHMGYSVEKAVGTSLFIIIFNGLSATISYWRRGILKPGAWIIMALLMAPSSMIGAQIATIAPRGLLRLIIALIVTLYGLNLLRRTLLSPMNSTSSSIRHYNPLIAPLVGVTAGFIAGLTGIGGGAILMPVLISALKTPVREAIAASMLSIVISSTSGSIIHLINGNIIFNLAIPFALGALIGAQIGSMIAAKSKPRTLTIVVGLILVLVGILTMIR